MPFLLIFFFWDCRGQNVKRDSRSYANGFLRVVDSGSIYEDSDAEDGKSCLCASPYEKDERTSVRTLFVVYMKA